MNCKNCQAEVTGDYCSNCGQPVKPKRINGTYLLHELLHVLHFERGILYTIRELLINPGQSVRYYLTENRSRLVKPILFIIVTSLIYTFFNYFFHYESSYSENIANNEATAIKFSKWVQAHYGYSNILMAVFITLWIKLFFKKYNFNFFEILILLCYVMGIGMLIFLVFGLIQAIIHVSLIQYASVVGIMYATWAIGQFFEKGKIGSYVKAFFAYLLGMVSFLILIILIGVSIDIIKNQ